MMSDWSYWCLLAAWAIAFGLSIFWNVKYCKLKQAYKNLKYLNELKENYSVIGASRRRRYNEDGSYVEYKTAKTAKTAWLTDMAIEQKIKLQEHFLMVDAQSLIPRREIETPVLIANFPLKTNELEDKK